MTDWNDYDPPKPEPTEYSGGTGFQSFESSNPTTPKRGADLDAEFDKIALSLKETQNRARMLQREDGSMAEAVVRRESLQNTVTALLEAHEAAAATSESNAAASEAAAATSESNAAASEAAAATSESNAAASEDKAAQWSSENEDVEVEPDEYSALHWARKAEAWAVKASEDVIQDDQVSTVSTWSSDKVTTELQNTETSANGYTDAEVAGAKSYTDAEVAGAKSYTDAEVAEAKSYTDAEVAEAKSYTDAHAGETGSVHGVPAEERAFHTGDVAAGETVDYFRGAATLTRKQATDGAFTKPDPLEVIWAKTGLDTAEVQKDLRVQVADKVLLIPEGTSVQMPTTLSAGEDYAIWIDPDGNVIADSSFSTAPVTDAVWRGGFHFAPGGNADLDPAGTWANHTGGDTTPQINEYSFWDWKFRPSAPDPRGLTLVNGAFWTGMYLLRPDTTAGPLHVYGVDPARDGNPPQKPYGDGSTYGNAKPMNVAEVLSWNGFRRPDADEFQLLALGTTEETSAGGTGPGLTGSVSDRDRNKFTSAWGVFDATGVLRVWGRGELPATTDTTGVTEGRSDDIWRISRFVNLGGSWGYGSGSGSRCAGTNTADYSSADIGGRGVCDHLILV